MIVSKSQRRSLEIYLGFRDRPPTWLSLARLSIVRIAVITAYFLFFAALFYRAGLDLAVGLMLGMWIGVLLSSAAQWRVLLRMMTRISNLHAAALLTLLSLGTAGTSAAADPPTRFSVTVTGQGSDVMLIPGLATPGAVWDATVKQLAPTHRVHVVSVGGFGGSDGAVNKGDADMLPAVIAELAQYAAGLQRPAIIGHSLGGLIALEVAAQQPGLVSRILIVDALPFYPLTMNPAATVDMVRPMAAQMRAQVQAQTDAQYAAGAPMTAARLAKTEAARASVTKWAAASDRLVVAKAMVEDMLDDARPRLPQIKAKTMVLYAFDTTMGVPQTMVDSLYAAAYNGLAGATLKRIDGTYHFIMLDQPDVFAKEVEAFLR